MALNGAWGEEAAAQHAQVCGARVLARNFRGRRGELDLILMHEGVLVFGEVKARRDDQFGGGLAAVTPSKQRKIALTAMEFLLRTGRNPDATECRFDVFVVSPGPVVEWTRGAFQVETG